MEKDEKDFERLMRLCASVGIKISRDDIDKLGRYVDLLKKWAVRINLVSKRDFPFIVERHVFDSLVVLRAIELYGINVHVGLKIADVGSGAGFPGVPVSVVCKRCQVDLIEPRKKRCVFLEVVLRSLPIGNARVLCSRVECVNFSYDLMLLRAIFPPEEAVRRLGSFVDRGTILCMFLGGGRQPVGEIPGYRCTVVCVDTPVSKKFFLFVSL